MQGLQEIWGLPVGENSWSTAGYLGAISNGDATCGLLIGSTVALGMRSGQNKTCLPLEDKKERDFVIAEVSELYEDFIGEFTHTQCIKLTQCDFSKPKDAKRYIDEDIYKHKCFKFFNFVMNRFVSLEDD